MLSSLREARSDPTSIFIKDFSSRMIASLYTRCSSNLSLSLSGWTLDHSSIRFVIAGFDAGVSIPRSTGVDGSISSKLFISS